jgi:hypothetical protein
MSEKLNVFLNEARVYQSQGLLAQAKEKYLDILELLKTGSELSGTKKLIGEVNNKIKAIQQELEEIDNEKETPQLSEEHQDLIRNIFSYSKSKNMAAVEGAVALADFGQYDKALIEFQGLLNNEMIPKMVVAKNMLRCHVTLGSPQKAIDQIKSWAEDSHFSQSELIFLQNFLENLLKEEDILDFVFDPVIDSADHYVPGKNVEDFFEIYSVRIQPCYDSRDKTAVDLDVTYQVGNTFRFHIKADQKNMLSRFNPGDHLDRVQCYSPSSLFNTSGTVSNKTKIASGPLKGDYTVELTISEH